MRWWVSAAAVAVAACSASTGPRQRPVVQAPPPPAVSACKQMTATCDPAISDETAMTVVRGHCGPCHADNGISGYPFSTAAALAAEPTSDMVATCQMPPDGAPLLSPQDRAIVVGWAACRVPPQHL